MQQQIDDKQWQDGSLVQHKDVGRLLMQRALISKPMDNFSLPHSDLSHINLVNQSSKTGYQLTNGDFYRTNFSYAHCFKLDFSGSSLMKADFNHANLHCANLTNCNLLGTKFGKAKLENVKWDHKVLQERLAENAVTDFERLDLYEQAEEVYRNLRITTEKQGLFDVAGRFFQREMITRRKQMPLISLSRLISKIVDLFCGYGEEPIQILGFTWGVIFIFTLLYFGTGIENNSQQIIFSYSADVSKNIKDLLDCLYFSIVTFTTLGYGDLTPFGYSKVFAAIEAIIGSFTLALFVVVFVKKMTR